MTAEPQDSERRRPSVSTRRRTRRLLRNAPVVLTALLGIPATLAGLVGGRFEAAGIAVLATLVAGVAQAVLSWVARRLRIIGRRDLRLVNLMVAMGLAAVLIELVIPASFALYIPVVGLAAALGRYEGIVIGTVAVALYLLPVALVPGRDPDLFARGVAGAAVAALVAGGARYFVGSLERATDQLRSTAARERRRVRQIAGIERVGRLLATGPSSDALNRVMDVLVEQFGYQYTSIYLAADDGILNLGAQRGYATTIDTFDGTYGVVGRVMRQRHAELIPDVSIDPDYVAANPDVLSEISAPLIVADEFLGIVNVESSGRQLDGTDLRIVASVADQLATYVALGRERERLAELAIRDPLTGLHNRRYLDDSMTRLFAARARQPEDRREALAIVLFDLDEFGELNKQHGLAAGDEVLRRFGAILGDRFRLADLVARYGGEEFLVVLGGATLEDAERRSNDVREEFAAERFEQLTPDRVTVSAGCTMLGQADVGDPAALIAAADVGLSMAKRAGRNRVVSVSSAN